MNTIKIFIASEPGNEKAEQTLEWSIRNTTSGPFEITWMTDALDSWKGWNTGRDNRNQNSGKGWKTNFSCFRWAIPELCNFSGRAIYLDVDQLVLKDIREMWELDLRGANCLTIRPERTDVMIMDCSKFNQPWWPKIKDMKPSGKSQRYYRILVQEHGQIGQLHGKYNCLDGDGLSEETRLIHYTKMDTQPWHPFPNALSYKEHKNKVASDLWHEAYSLSQKCKEFCK